MEAHESHGCYLSHDDFNLIKYTILKHQSICLNNQLNGEIEYLKETKFKNITKSFDIIHQKQEIFLTLFDLAKTTNLLDTPLNLYAKSMFHTVNVMGKIFFIIFFFKRLITM